MSVIELVPADSVGKAGASPAAKKRSRRPARKEKEGAGKKESPRPRSAVKATA
jgi:hypothetical protein